MNIFDLHAEIWSTLQAQRERLPHALLLTGQRGLGKYALASAIAAGLLCERPRENGAACGECLACNWFTQGNHPDFRLLQPEALAESEGGDEDSRAGTKKPSQQITIDQIRELDEYLNVGTHRAGLRIVIIHPAEAMNRSTANAVLKTLEEPTPGSLFLLVSNEPLRLLPTIRSRCQTLRIGLPEAERSRALLAEEGVASPDRWLALTGGAPMLAIELAKEGKDGTVERLIDWFAGGDRLDVLAQAAEAERVLRESKGRVGLRHVVEWLQKWVVDLTLAREALPVRYFVGQQATINALAQATASDRLLRFHRQLARLRRQAEQPLNARLFLEELFLDYRTLFGK